MPCPRCRRLAQERRWAARARLTAGKAPGKAHVLDPPLPRAYPEPAAIRALLAAINRGRRARGQPPIPLREFALDIRGNRATAEARRRAARDLA